MMRLSSKTALRRLYVRQTGPRRSFSPGHEPFSPPPRRYFSDNLLGYSPMASSKPDTAASTTNKKKMPTAHEVSTSGGVWAPTSAKRDKITELKIALEDGQELLDDAATPGEKLDLDLTDGLLAIVHIVDQGKRRSQDLLLDEFHVWLDHHQADLPEQVNRSQWEDYLTRVSHHAETLQHRRSTECLREVRDFYEWKKTDDDNDNGGGNDDDTLAKVNDLHSSGEAFDGCVLRLQLGLVQAAADHLATSWDELTTLTDADIDRAAVRDAEVESQASTLSRDKMHAVLRAFATGSCADRVDSLWKLIDRDEDGLLDQVEMDRVAKLSLVPVQNALKTYFEDCLEAYPVRTELPVLEDNDDHNVEPKSPGWRARRLEQNTKKRLLKLCSNAIQCHFEDEVEMPHRLRCIYAWSDKAHQNNATESVLVDSHGASSVLGAAGRKRYVELEPKISHPEFLEVQQEHFPHLDRVGTEIMKSFREDLWVDQGKGRQNQELRRDCFVFLTVVSVIDGIIMWL